MKWLLHIGTTKTGSKAIQQFLASDAEALVEPRILYVKAGRCGVWHEELFYSIENGRTDLLASARQEALATRAEYAILSYEGFYQLCPESIRLIRETLGEAQILLFIRRQYAHANSWYNQLIKAHRVPISAIEEFERGATSYDPILDHWATIEKWRSAFGPDAVHVVIYDKTRSSVQVLLEVLRAPLPPVHALPNPNPALTPDQAAMLRGIKELVGHSADLPQIVDTFHQRYSANFMDTTTRDAPYFLDLTTCRAIMNHYVLSNERVRQHWFPQRDTLFLPLPDESYAPLDLADGLVRAKRFLREYFSACLPQAVVYLTQLLGVAWDLT
jgi:hypothetical protein